MKKIAMLALLFCFINAEAKIFSTGAKAPILLPHGRSGSTSVAVYQTIDELTFTLADGGDAMFMIVADLYLAGCSATGDSRRCNMGESNAGNQKLMIIEVSTGRVVLEEIFKYTVSAGTSFDPSVTKVQDKVAVKAGVNMTTSPHIVAENLKSGNYIARYQIRNDYFPMNVHSKRLTVIAD